MVWYGFSSTSCWLYGDISRGCLYEYSSVVLDLFQSFSVHYKTKHFTTNFYKLDEEMHMISIGMISLYLTRLK